MRAVLPRARCALLAGRSPAPLQINVAGNRQRRGGSLPSIPVSIDGRELHLELQPTSLFAAGATLQVHDDDGVTTVADAIDARAYYGCTVHGDPAAICHFRVFADGTMRGVFVAHRQGYIVDPATDHFATPPSEYNHVIYKGATRGWAAPAHPPHTHPISPPAQQRRTCPA